MSFVTPTSDPHHDHSVRRRIKEMQKEIKKKSWIGGLRKASYNLKHFSRTRQKPVEAQRQRGVRVARKDYWKMSWKVLDRSQEKGGASLSW